MRWLLRWTLLVWGVFDVGTGVLSIVAPHVVADLLWPSAQPDALILLRRTGAFWLMMGIVQLAAFRTFPSPRSLYIAALVRVTDGIADIAWLAGGTAFSRTGWMTIGPSPVLCAIVAYLAFRIARESERAPH